MSTPNKSLPSSNVLIARHSKARVIKASPANTLLGQRQLSKAEALAQVAKLK